MSVEKRPCNNSLCFQKVYITVIIGVIPAPNTIDSPTCTPPLAAYTCCCAHNHNMVSVNQTPVVETTINTTKIVSTNRYRQELSLLVEEDISYQYQPTSPVERWIIMFVVV